MKTILVRLISRISGDWGILLATASLAATSVHAQNLPNGTWDCVLSGHRSGTAYFDFAGTPQNGTFTVFEVMVPNPVNTNSDTSTGGGGRDNTGGRGGGSGGGGSGFIPGPQIFGSELTNGYWTLDAKGRVIGAFIETSLLQSCKTEAIPVVTNIDAPSDVPINFTNGATTDPVFCVTSVTATNDLGGGVTNYSEQTICFTNVLLCSATTNAVSFVGTVVPGKRITLKCSTPFGDTIYKGVPAVFLNDISGSYSGIKHQAGVSYIELFTLTPSFTPNTYDVALTGPGYSYHGSAMLSSQKRISFSLGQDPTIPTNQVTVIRATTGPFNAKKLTAKTKGLDGDSDTAPQIEFDTQPIP